MKWISTEKYLPGDKSDWVVVRCVDEGVCNVFYFMACYSKDGWSFFDDDNDYENSMRITHWLKPDDVEEKDYYVKEDGSIIY